VVPSEVAHLSAIIDHPDLLLYDFGAYHPLRPERVTAGLDLLQSAGLWDPEGERVLAAPAEIPELELVHASDYIRAVEDAGSVGLPASLLAGFGLTQRDNPPFPDMHYAASLVAGGSLVAMRAIMDGSLDHAFFPPGGLHHAHRARAHGFCIYNDAAVAAAAAVRAYGARVLYLDFDCHHGDGVQWLFYTDPRVVTLSFHETTRYLFPGVGGEPNETGDGEGAGTAVNLPFFPFTRDACWQEALDRVLSPLIRCFPADLLITNHGCDTHVWDPLTHLALTTSSLQRQARMAHSIAHEHTRGRWLAVGSGGYDWRRVVPRSWAIVWTEMTGRELPDRLPAAWSERWLAGAEPPHPTTFLDNPEVSPPFEGGANVRDVNRAALETVVSLMAKLPGRS
jgi:acetoin utilization protein AcuC